MGRHQAVGPVAFLHAAITAAAPAAVAVAEEAVAGKGRRWGGKKTRTKTKTPRLCENWRLTTGCSFGVRRGKTKGKGIGATWSAGGRLVSRPPFPTTPSLPPSPLPSLPPPPPSLPPPLPPPPSASSLAPFPSPPLPPVIHCINGTPYCVTIEGYTSPDPGSVGMSRLLSCLLFCRCILFYCTCDHTSAMNE